MKPRDVEHHEPTFTAPGGLVIRWLGTAGYELTAPSGHTLLIDPYVTRTTLVPYLTSRLRPDAEYIDAAIGRADAVLVGHSHFDHVLDTPLIACKTGAHVYGSRSTANLMRACRVPATQVTELNPDRASTFEVGPFTITAIPSLHSRFALGKSVPYAGDIDAYDPNAAEAPQAAPCTCDVHLPGKDYRCGDVYTFLISVGGYRVLHLGSANLAEHAIPREARGVDLMLMCIAARFATDRFIPRALAAYEPQLVMPMHYDFMWRSADLPMWLLPRTEFGRFHSEVRRFSRDLDVVTLPLRARRLPTLPT